MGLPLISDPGSVVPHLGSAGPVYSPPSWIRLLLAPRLLATTLLYLAAYDVPLARGLSKGGIHDLDQSFVRDFDKDALYFTDPFPLPPEFGRVVRHFGLGRHEVAEIYLALFLSGAEHDHVKQHGAASFEALMQGADADPFAVHRASVA